MCMLDFAAKEESNVKTYLDQKLELLLLHLYFVAREFFTFSRLSNTSSLEIYSELQYKFY